LDSTFIFLAIDSFTLTDITSPLFFKNYWCYFSKYCL